MPRGPSDVHFTGNIIWVASVFRENLGVSAAYARSGNPDGLAVCVSAAWCECNAITATPGWRLLAAVPSAADAGYDLCCGGAVGDDVGAAGSRSR